MIDYNYPDIFMGEAVQKNLLITDGTVTVSGDTYTVTGDTVTITNSELETEAFELHQSINSDMQLRFGSCESAYISFVFRKTNITTLIGKTLKVYIIPNHEASKILQLGVFKVQTDKLSYDGTQRQITAYDAMYDIINSDVTDWYNTQFPNANSTKSLGMLIDSFLTYFGLTAENIQSLVNKTRSIRRTIDPEQLSGADVIRAMCEINGVFGMITNEGNFRFKKLLANMRSESAATLVHEIPVTEYMDIHFEDYDAKKIDAAKIISDKGSDSYVFAPDPENTYVISGNFLISDYDSNELHRVLMPLRNTLYNNYYTACTVNALGNPVLEPGDSIKIITKQGETYTYILERHMRGVQALRDTYTARGEEYSSESLNSISSRFSRISSEVSRSESGGGITVNAEFAEIIRNIGFRLLDEPTVTFAEYDDTNVQIELKWTDPSDISSNEPVPATWAGTVVVRKEGSAPLHRWDGTLIVNSTTRDEYSSTALVDSSISEDKTYYYGIFPYDTKGDYRYTKVISISSYTIPYPDITSLSDIRCDKLTVNYEIPTGYTWSQVGIVYKKGSAPADKTDGSTVDITGGDGSEVVTGLDDNSTYYFRIFSTESTTLREFIGAAQSATTKEFVRYTFEELRINAPTGSKYFTEQGTDNENSFTGDNRDKLGEYDVFRYNSNSNLPVENSGTYTFTNSGGYYSGQRVYDWLIRTVNAKKITCEVRIIHDTNRDGAYLSVNYVGSDKQWTNGVFGTQYCTSGSAYQSTFQTIIPNNEWTSIVWEGEDAQLINYFRFVPWQGQYDVRNIVFYCEE